MFELLDDHVQRTPSAVALIVPDQSERHEITYIEFGSLLEELASELNRLGVSKGSVAALCMPRTVSQVVAVWGVLKSGAAFLPIDAEAPESRKSLFLQESEAAVVIHLAGDEAAAQLAESLSITSIVMGTKGNRVSTSERSAHATVERIRPAEHDLALLIYTSGTTGQPKGIRYDHTHLMHGVYFFGHQCEMTSQSIGMLPIPYFWAVVEYEMFPALIVEENWLCCLPMVTRAQSLWQTPSRTSRSVCCRSHRRFWIWFWTFMMPIKVQNHLRHCDTL